MTRTYRYLPILLALCAVAAGEPESPTLLDSDDYAVRTADSGGYVVVEKASGTVLVREKAPVFGDEKTQTPMPVKRWVTSSPGLVTGTCVSAAGDNAGGIIALQFIAPGILRVMLKGPEGTTAVGEQFTDQGEEYFGLHSGVRGKRGLSLRGEIVNMVSQGRDAGNWDSANAPFFVTNRGWGLYVDTVRYGTFTLRDPVRAGIINFPVRGSDTRGYGGPRPNQCDEGKMRWLAFSCYSTVFEVMLDRFDIRQPADALMMKVMRNYAQRHHQLLPYSRSCLYASTQTGMPVTRAMFLEFPDDPALLALDDQYMFGPSLLVAPVDPLPLLIREGTILPLGDILRCNNDWTDDWQPRLRVEVYPGRTSSQFPYYTPKNVEFISCAVGDTATTITFADLGHAGERAVFCEAPGKVALNDKPLAEPYAYDRATRCLTVPFNGSCELVLTGVRNVFANLTATE